MAKSRVHSADKPQISGPADDESVRQPAGLILPADISNDEPSPANRVRAASIGAFEAPVLPHLPPIIRSKIEPPPLRPTTLTRHRLLDRLPFNDPKRVTLIVAEPGFGKTTLLADFSSRYHGRCLWYRLDETDRDWVTMANYVIAAAREVVPDFGKAATTLLTPITGASPQKEAVLGTLMHELQALADQPTAFVFDDVQEIEDSRDAAEFFERLLRDSPASFAFVFSSRRRPTMHLAKWSAAGEMSELTTDDLRFSASETDRLFAEAYRQPLEPEVLAELDERTKGWAASLQLFYSLVQGRTASGVRSAVRLLSGANSPVYEFLAEEVLDQMPAPLAEFALRCSILDSIVAEYVVAALGPETTMADAEALMADAEKLGVLTRTSHGSRARQFHPLLREFLATKLGEQLSADDVAAIHGQVARAAEKVDLLAACYHYIEAGEREEAMRCLGESAIQTLGSGRTGAASGLIARLTSIPKDPAVLAIQARRSLDLGDIHAASALLTDLDIANVPPTLRAVVRHTRLSLGWRSGDSALMFSTLRDIADDRETPGVLREIAQVFIDSSPMSASRAPLPSLSRRLRQMAADQSARGHDYYSAISLLNAGGSSQNAGFLLDALHLGQEAIDAFDRLAFDPSERQSAYALMAMCSFELDRVEAGNDYIRLATESELTDGDVHADIAYALAAIGEQSRSLHHLTRAEALEPLGRLDMEGRHTAGIVRSMLMMATRPYQAVQQLEGVAPETPLDLGYRLFAKVVLGVAYLLLDNDAFALSVATSGLTAALAQGNRRCEARLQLVASMAQRDSIGLRSAIVEAENTGALALLDVADALGGRLHLLSPFPEEVRRSIAGWPKRWRPILRRQLETGNTPAGHIAADLLDEFGDHEDIGRLRAFDKIYGHRNGRSVGRRLARRLAPMLKIHDLGRGYIQVGQREIPINRIRRKPASLLLYLVTRPGFTATREQVLEDLWPEGDPDSGANSLNQSLHFLRRRLDPWYEVDVSHDYVVFDSDLLWLDRDEVEADSASLFDVFRGGGDPLSSSSDVLSILSRYQGQFCPEFEYEEWTAEWRSRVHAAYLDFAHRSISGLVRSSDLAAAKDVALLVLAVDPSAMDIEQKLVWLYARSGSQSAAEAQYQHLAATYRADGLDAPSLEETLRLSSAP